MKTPRLILLWSCAALFLFVAAATQVGATASVARSTSAVRTHRVTMIYLDSGPGYGTVGIWAALPNGKGLHLITTKGGGAVISPDGKRVWCFCLKGIGVMKPDGSHLRKVASLPPYLNHPSLSGVGTVAVGSGSQGIAVGNADGSGMHAIYSGVVPEMHAGIPYDIDIGNVVISPDGSKVAFAKNEDNFLFCQDQYIAEPKFSECHHTIQSVNVINSDGSELHAVTMVNDPPRRAFGQAGVPESFSADNSGLVMSALDSCDGWGFVATEGTIQNILCSVPHNGSLPFLSPNGTHFAFTAIHSGAGTGVFTAGLDGSGLHRIIPHTGNVTSWAKVEVPKP